MKHSSKVIVKKNALPIRVRSFQHRGSERLQSLSPGLSNRS